MNAARWWFPLTRPTVFDSGRTEDVQIECDTEAQRVLAIRAGGLDTIQRCGVDDGELEGDVERTPFPIQTLEQELFTKLVRDFAK